MGFQAHHAIVDTNIVVWKRLWTCKGSQEIRSLSPDNNRVVYAVLCIVLMDMVIGDALAIAVNDPDLNVSEEGLGQTVKIGAIYNLEGSQSPLDLPSANGAMLAVKEINAHGGINGREIELILCDGESDSAKVRGCAEGLIEKNVSAIMGLSDTDMVLAAVPAASAAGIPFVTSGATSPELPEEYHGLFLACFGDNVQAAATAEYACNEMGLKSCTLLVDGDMEFARVLAGSFKERYLGLRGEIIRESFVNSTDLVNLSQAILDEDPDMIYLAAGPEDAAYIIEILRKTGIQSPIFGGDSFDSPELKMAGMGSIVFSTHALLDENSSSAGDFVRAYRAEYGYPPENAFSALGYDTVNLLADAIDRADPDNPSEVIEALLNTTGLKGVTGEISYQSGSRIPNKDVTITLMTDGQITDSRIVRPETSV